MAGIVKNLRVVTRQAALVRNFATRTAPLAVNKVLFTYQDNKNRSLIPVISGQVCIETCRISIITRKIKFQSSMAIRWTIYSTLFNTICSFPSFNLT